MSDDRGGWRSEVGDRRLEVGAQERLDLAIDRTVREMIDVEPRADMRARVEERVSSSQFPVSSFQRFGVPIAAAAVLVLAVILVRRAEPPAQAPVVAKAVDQQLPAAAASAEQPAPQRPLAVRREIATEPRQAIVSQTRRTVVVGAMRTGAAEPNAIEPLQPIAPIVVAPIGQSNITPEPITVRPLSPISEMQIAPLNPPDRRD